MKTVNLKTFNIKGDGAITVELPAPKSFDDTKVAKLRKRIHLPKELAAEIHEERHIVFSIADFLENYSRKAGWSQVFLDNRIAIVQAVQKEVILRRHPKLGNFILFRVWKDGQ